LINTTGSFTISGCFVYREFVFSNKVKYDGLKNYPARMFPVSAYRLQNASFFPEEIKPGFSHVSALSVFKTPTLVSGLISFFKMRGITQFTLVS